MHVELALKVIFYLELHGHGDEHWPTEVTSNTYFWFSEPSRWERQDDCFRLCAPVRQSRLLHQMRHGMSGKSSIQSGQGVWSRALQACRRDCPSCVLFLHLPFPLSWHFRGTKGQGLGLIWAIQDWLPRVINFKVSPAASPEIWHHTVWRTCLFIAYEKWLYYQFSSPHL